MARKIQDMVVVITGASAGIGRALAVELGRRGARLVLTARRMELLEELNASLGGGHLCVRADVAEPEDCARLILAANERFGRIDTLVCNAGFGLIRTVAKMTIEEMRQIFAVNLFGTTECIRHVLPIMTAQDERDRCRGQIMLVSSAAARRGLPYFSAYAATKASQLSIAEGLRVEMMRHGIAVTTVHPMQTETDFFDAAEQASAARIPGGRRGVKTFQTATVVARKMADAIARPKRELWPLFGSRALLFFAAMFPGVSDWAMGKALRGPKYSKQAV